MGIIGMKWQKRSTPAQEVPPDVMVQTSALFNSSLSDLEEFCNSLNTEVA